MTLPVEQTWFVLVELLTDLRKKDVDVPVEITEDIRLVRTSINFYKSDTENPEMIRELKRINDMLNSIQEKLLELAESVAPDYPDEWIEKLKRASRGEEVHKPPETKSRFIVGAPPGFAAARVHLKEPIAEDRVQDIAETHSLIIEFEEDDLLAVYGDSEDIKKGLKEIGSFFRE
ncbi:DUF2096 domain-containing protein [Methanothermobacter sp.]|uniref:DUF2096 domain-containing protein n=1 Tax=Methanothermobacter sp. TaxID=1884223 RepID=UPI0026095908|nr:DUF2096 domain-containing protein [Methanothermobacter sp.]MDI9615247.1 DUF2096 domain-containing protein [Methanothermobacter sp.]